MRPITEQRRLIGELIRNAEDHLTAEQIYLAAKERMPSIAVGTVYRNLGLMERDGEIRRISVPNSPDYFDKSTKLHDHLLCRRCGRLLDVCFEELQSLFANCTDMQVDSYELTLHGTCSLCIHSDERV